MRIDDFEKLEDVPAEQHQTVALLGKQLSQIGVRSVADYTLVKTAFPLNSMTVRLFVFEDTEKCQAWWKKAPGELILLVG